MKALTRLRSYLVIGFALSLGLPTSARTQTAKDPPDVATDAVQNRLAVATSGIWNIDGEYKGTRGEYYKLSGYFAYVASTTRSRDNGEEAVIAMFLEPMAGGSARWMGARLSCDIGDNSKTRCYAFNGATPLLDLNILFSTIPFRGDSSRAEITEPDEKSLAKRFEGRSTPRGKFAMIPDR